MATNPIIFGEISGIKQGDSFKGRKEMVTSSFHRSWGKGIDLVCRNAPHVIIAHSPKTNPSGNTDCTIALAHLDLIAPSFGLGTCWAGILNMAVLLWPKMKEVLALPDGHKYHGAMILGYPKYKYQSMPPRNSANIIWD